MEWSRREVLAAASATATLLSARSSAAAGDVLTPEAFGAAGDGRTNDTDAFVALSARINAAGGGSVVLRPVTYIVGKQLGASAGPEPFAFTPSPILHFTGCTAAVAVRGNGAKLRAAAGLRFGSFDARTGMPADRAMPFYDRNYLASPYLAMILAERCTGEVQISDIELDGALGSLLIGAPWGDVDRQIPGTGLMLKDNKGPERVLRVRSHHHALDGMIIDGSSQRTASSTISDVICDHNARQGCSIVGGANYAFDRSRFTRTGKAGLRSAPSAGVDIEAEDKLIRNLSFTACEFTDNSGAGLLAESGDSEGAVFDDCTFVGTTAWSAWANKPQFKFRNCTFVGAMVHPYGSPDPERAAQFADCRFLDDPALSPTGVVYGGTGQELPIVQLPDNPNARFDRCTFKLTAKAVLPWSTYEIIFSDCTMSQRSPVASYPRGTFFGTTVIEGNAKLENSLIRGTVILNGRLLPRSV